MITIFLCLMLIVGIVGILWCFFHVFRNSKD